MRGYLASTEVSLQRMNLRTVCITNGDIAVLERSKFIQENWDKLKIAPWTYWGFLVICVSAFCTAEYWLLDKRRYAPLSDTVTMQNERLSEKDDELKFLQYQLAQRKSALETTEKELNRFRNMVLLNPEKNTLYTQMTHEELRIRALNLVLKMRESSRLTKRQEGEASTNYDKAMIKEGDYQKKVDTLRKYISISQKLADDLTEEYKRKYKSEAMLIRNEILSRVPENAEEKNRTVLGASIEHYELIINTFMFEAVADNLARLAMSLPQ